MKKLNNLLQSCLAALPVVPKDIIDKISPAQVRILLAKDVLEQLNTGKFKSQRNEWIKKSNGDSCFGCALGGLFYSTISKTKTDKAGKYINRIIRSSNHFDALKGELGRFFSKKQIYLIELAFEGKPNVPRPRPRNSNYVTENHVSDTEMQQACNWFSRSAMNDDLRMEELMQNIIENEGTFIP